MMKRLVVYLFLLLVFGCGPKGDVKEGIYTRFSSSEYSKAYDTLIVDPVDQSGNTCVIQRKTGYIRIVNGMEQSKQWRSENMLTVYDPVSHRLNDPKTGRLFTFRNKDLFFGTALYKKE